MDTFHEIVRNAKVYQAMHCTDKSDLFCEVYINLCNRLGIDVFGRI